jgi:hypothetical protein
MWSFAHFAALTIFDFALTVLPFWLKGVLVYHLSRSRALLAELRSLRRPICSSTVLVRDWYDVSCI